MGPICREYSGYAWQPLVVSKGSGKSAKYTWIMLPPSESEPLVGVVEPRDFQTEVAKAEAEAQALNRTHSGSSVGSLRDALNRTRSGSSVGSLSDPRCTIS